MNARAHFLMLARYNVWATHRLLEAVEKLSDEDYRRHVGLFVQSIHGTLNRGQITAALTMLGQACPVLDVVYMLQEDERS